MKLQTRFFAMAAWLLATYAVAAVLIGCGNSNTKEETVPAIVIQGTRAPYFPFDTTAYRAEREALIVAATPYATEPGDTAMCRGVLNESLRRGFPQRFWATVRDSFPEATVVLSFELGQDMSSHFWIGAIMRTPDGGAVVTCPPRRPERVTARLMNDSTLESTVINLFDSLDFHSLEPEFQLSEEAVILMVFMYGPDGRHAWISNCPLCDKGARSTPVIRYLNDVVFGLRKE